MRWLTEGGLGGVGSHLLAGLGVEVSVWDVSGCQKRERCGCTDLRRASDMLTVVGWLV